MVQSAGSLLRKDPTRCYGTNPAVRCPPLLKSEMRAILMMVTNILREQSLQMAFTQRNNVVQQVSSATFDPPLRHTVLPGTPERGLHRAHCQGSNCRWKLTTIFRISIEDQRIQYACAEYIAIIEKYRMVASMSRPANPYDNASCESFMKTLKREEIYANKYEDLEHLRANIAEFIEEYYNRQRLHSALGYRSPEEFEQQAGGQAESRSATMEFFENKENSRKISTGLPGKGTQVPSPSPEPFSC